MSERRRAHRDYFPERIRCRKECKRGRTAARDAGRAHPPGSEEEGPEVFDHLRLLEQEQCAKE
jgi:hypothetical protein